MTVIPNLLVQALAPFHKVRVLALDPGETTGACVFEGSNLIHACQLPTGLMPLAAVNVRSYLKGYQTTKDGQLVQAPHYGKAIDYVVIEDYRVYSWKTKDHAWAGLHTARLIGAVELLCFDLHRLETNGGYELTKQTAQQAKGFCTDDKLQAWGLWQVGEQHARDAIRHAVYYLLFKVAKVHEPS